MIENQLVQNFGAQTNTPVNVITFLGSLLLSGFLAFILQKLYLKCSRSFSNRQEFSRNFFIISMATMLIISIVKSSLALSLGLVGALSIVRFRTAIKEPEELCYLLLAIAIGLGCGAHQWFITLIAFVTIALLILIRSRHDSPFEQQTLYISIDCPEKGELKLEQLTQILKQHCETILLKRFSENGQQLEASFKVQCDNFDQLNQAKNDILTLNPAIEVSYLDQQGLG